MGKLAGLAIVVTGAGAGMGRAMSKLFAAEGARILATDLRDDRLESLKSEVKAEGGKIATLKADVSREEDVKKMIAQCISLYGSVDGLVNNAGIMDDFMPAAEVSTELWNRVMGINLNGPFMACREVLPHMLAKGTGVILNISSVGGLYGCRAGAAYTASKHAIIGLSKNIAFMYAQKGIRCNVIAPGGVNTSIGESMKPNEFGFARMRTGMESNPRMGEPNEIAAAALFLMSAEASFVNGAVLTVDGGWSAY